MWLKSSKIKELEHALEVQSQIAKAHGDNMESALRDLQKAIEAKKPRPREENGKAHD